MVFEWMEYLDCIGLVCSVLLGMGEKSVQRRCIFCYAGRLVHFSLVKSCLIMLLSTTLAKHTLQSSPASQVSISSSSATNTSCVSNAKLLFA